MLAALVPPPRHPLIQFHRVFAPRCSWRASVVPERSTPPRSTQPDEDSDRRFERKSWWIDWATLLRRVHDIDVLACPCGGRLRPVELVTDEDHARDVLRRLGLASDPPPIARARDPAFDRDLDAAPSFVNS